MKRPVSRWPLLRGGSWHFNPDNCRSAYRSGNNTLYRFNNAGFRIVKEGNEKTN